MYYIGIQGMYEIIDILDNHNILQKNNKIKKEISLYNIFGIIVGFLNADI